MADEDVDGIRIDYVELKVTDTAEARRFYGAAFGWSTQKWDGPMEYWFAITGEDGDPGINGGISIGEPNLTEGQLTLGVSSLDETLKKVAAAGGKITSEKRPIPGVGWLATVSDTEGNVFGLMQDDETAS